MVKRTVPWWLIALVIIGAALSATGAVIALITAPHLNAQAADYALYFATRNLAVALLLGLTLALRSWRALSALMTLTALIQSMDAITAILTNRLTLVPIDLVYAALFLLGAARTQGHPFWSRAAWQNK